MVGKPGLSVTKLLTMILPFGFFKCGLLWYGQFAHGWLIRR